MDHHRFDSLARSLAAPTSRRRLVAAIVGGFAASLLDRDAGEAAKKPKKPKPDKRCKQTQDGQPCGECGTCQGGVCVGALPLACEACEYCARDATCQPNDGLECMGCGTCRNRVCVANPDRCNGCEECDALDLICIPNPAWNGSSCGNCGTCQDGSCQVTDPPCPECQTCLNGFCVPVAADGTACGGECGSCQSGDCVPVAARCPECHTCVASGASTFTCLVSPDGSTCSGGGTCQNGLCERPVVTCPLGVPPCAGFDGSQVCCNLDNCETCSLTEGRCLGCPADAPQCGNYNNRLLACCVLEGMQIPVRPPGTILPRCCPGLIGDQNFICRQPT